MDCHRVREAMFRATDNELEAELVAPFKDHLSFCPNCNQQFTYVGRLVATIRLRCCRYDAPSQLRVRILASFPHRGGLYQEVAE
jgi:mycothiol system anti-sigma-R factor